MFFVVVAVCEKDFFGVCCAFNLGIHYRGSLKGPLRGLLMGLLIGPLKGPLRGLLRGLLRVSLGSNRDLGDCLVFFGPWRSVGPYTYMSKDVFVRIKTV